jgi:hypothetical protein
MKLHVAVVANSHISSQLTVDLCLSELDLVFSASFSRMRQVSGLVKEHASTPLSHNQVWFMRQDSDGEYPFMVRGRAARAKSGQHQVALSQPETRRGTD